MSLRAIEGRFTQMIAYFLVNSPIRDESNKSALSWSPPCILFYSLRQESRFALHNQSFTKNKVSNTPYLRSQVVVVGAVFGLVVVGVVVVVAVVLRFG